MKYVLAIVAIVVAAAFLAWRGGAQPDWPMDMPRGVPIAMIAGGKTVPQVGLTAPLPEWMPLPESGTVVGAGLYPPQPPFGAAAVVTLELRQSQQAFTTAYFRRLARDGYGVRHLPTPFNLIIDRPDDQFEADERKGARTIYITLRATHYAQLTFWDTPAPRLP